MSSPQPDPREEEDTPKRAVFDELHDAICFDDTVDKRYEGGLSNSAKTEYICLVLGYPQNGFNLDLPFPVEDWFASEDQSLINCGLYLNDLRTQFYTAVMRETGRNTRTFRRHAEAEFWRFQFNAESYARQMGHLLIDDRTIN